MTKRIPFLIAAALIALAWLPGTLSTSSAGAVVIAAGQEGGRDAKQIRERKEMEAKMMADMKASQEKMNRLVTKMNAATGDAKTTVMAELITELVREHNVMNEGYGHMMANMP